METSLTIIVPVHQGECSLDQRVDWLLDTLPELVECFEIVIVTHGASDQTIDVAEELRTDFPQVRVRHLDRRSDHGAIQLGLSISRGEVVFVWEPGARLGFADLERLWTHRDDDKLVVVRSGRSGAVDRDLMSRLQSWGMLLQQLSDQADQPGLQMIRRQAILPTAESRA